MQSVGLIPKHLPFSGYNNAVVNFRHALALDEHRVKFMPFFYTGRKPKHRYTDIHAFELSDAAGGDISDVIGGLKESAGVADFEVHINTMTGPDTNVEEVFFAGAHCGTVRFYIQRPFVIYDQKMLEVALCKMAHATISLVSPFDG